MPSNSGRIKLLLLANVVALGAFAIYWDRVGRCHYRFKNSISDYQTLHAELYSPHSCIRSMAAFDLQSLRGKAADSVPRLIELVLDEDPSVRWRSTAALGYIGVWNDDVINALIGAQNDTNEKVRYNSMFSLGVLPYMSAERISSGFRMPDKVMHTFLRATKDYHPPVAMKGIIHMRVSDFEKMDNEYRNAYQNQLRVLARHQDIKLQRYALAMLWMTLPADTVRREFPDFMSRLDEFEKLNESGPLSYMVEQIEKKLGVTTNTEPATSEETIWDIAKIEKLIAEAMVHN